MENLKNISKTVENELPENEFRNLKICLLFSLITVLTTSIAQLTNKN